jgi:hypothetical protein
MASGCRGLERTFSSDHRFGAPGSVFACRVALNSQLSLREIAGQLSVSYDTVKTHTRHIYRKLGVSTRQQAVAGARGENAR